MYRYDFDLVECAMAGSMLAWLVGCASVGTVTLLDTVTSGGYFW